MSTFTREDIERFIVATAGAFVDQYDVEGIVDDLLFIQSQEYDDDFSAIPSGRLYEVMSEHDRGFSARELIDGMRKHVANVHPVNQWKRGILAYVVDLIDSVEDYIESGDLVEYNAATRLDLRFLLLQGARGWHDYSEYSSLIYADDIADRLFGEGNYPRIDYMPVCPASCNSWTDLQTIALEEAFPLFADIYEATVQALSE